MQAHSTQLQKFYKQVLQQFKSRTTLNYRYRSSIKSQQLDKFLQKLEKSYRKQLFKIGLKLSLEKKSDNVIHQENQVKIEQEQRDYHVLSNTTGNNTTLSKNNSNHQTNQNLNKQKQQSSQSQQQDDLIKFRTQKQNKDTNKNPTNNTTSPIASHQVKLQQKQQQILNKQRNQQQIQQQQYRKRQQILSKRQQIISTHIIGTYSTRTKRYIPKDQRTKIQLENVFVRSYDKEMYFPKMTCEFTQTQYSSIRL